MLEISNLAIEGRVVVGGMNKSNRAGTALANSTKTVNTIRVDGKGKVGEPWEHRTTNAEHRTSNVRRSMFGVHCAAFDIIDFSFISG